MFEYMQTTFAMLKPQRTLYTIKMYRDERKIIFGCLIFTGIIALTFAGAPAPPQWTFPVVRTFQLEYTTTSGCEEVTRLTAEPLAGAGITFSVVSQGPEAGFATEQIDDVTGRLICDQVRIVNGGKKTYNVNVRAMDVLNKEFADISLVITAAEGAGYRGPTFIKPSSDGASEDSKIYLAETSKGGDILMWLSASDPDTAIALFQYSMDSSPNATKDLFEIVSNALKVKTSVTEGTFDYEAENAILQYPIVLEVSDGEFTSAVNTNIFVTDVNDNTPKFETIGNFDILESTPPGSSVYKVEASDADGTAPNNQITYRMQGSLAFSIDETTGIISVSPSKTFNYDITPTYSLTVKAIDNGPDITTLTAESQIRISIITAPMFVNLKEDTSVSIYENATSETAIFELSVTDKDNTGTMTVTILNQTPEEKFRLDGFILKPKTGARFDGSTQPEYKITFKASDETNEVISAMLTVTLIPINRVNEAVQKYISEDTPAGSQIARISADDFSDPSQVTFTMKGESSSDFDINEKNGKLLVAAGVKLDYTKRKSYTLIVTTTNGFSSAETPVIVFLQTSPKFVDPSRDNPGSTSIAISENTKAGAVIKIITAVDEDGDDLDYDILRQIPDTAKPLFEIIRRDDLIAGRKNSVDAYEVDTPDAILSYVLEIGVKDGRPSTADDYVNVTITIADVNEPPTFPIDILKEYNIPESMEPGTVIFTVTATDIDRTPEYRQISYSVTGTTEFTVSENTGEIRLATGTVLNKTSTPRYSFTLMATDGGAPALSSTVDMIVSIIKGCNMLQDIYGIWPVLETNTSITIACDDLYIGNYTRVCDVNGTWGPVTSVCKVKDSTLKTLQEQLDSVSITSGNVSGEIENILESLSKITENEIDAEIVTNVTDILKGVLNIAENSLNISDNSTEYFYETISNVLKPEHAEAFKQANVDGSDILDVVDKYMTIQQETKCNNLNTGDVNEIENNHIYTEIGRKSGEVVFPNNKQSETNIELSENTLKNAGITNVCFGGAYYNSLGTIMEKQVTTEGLGSLLPSGEVNSDIISIQLQTDPGISLTNLDPPVRITFSLRNGSYSDPVCVFWDYNITNGQSNNGAWSSEGCILEEITNLTANCACTHLTNFAILMSPSKISAYHSLVLGIISAVGCTISMICLVLTIVAHRIVWSAVRSNRTITLMHLCVALLLAFVVFLAGINRTESRVACIIIAALIQFLFLAVFFLMLFIGVEILLSVVQVFGSRFRLARLLPLAWFAPLVIVGVSLGVTKTEGYGNKEFCWLDINSGLIWSFVGPAAAIILVNIVIIVIVFKKMASATFVKSKTSATKIKTWLHSLCVLLPMLGITWLFGLLSVNSSMFILQYFFSIFNSLQGLFIFLFHCVFNRQIRQALLHRKERRRTLASFESEIKNTTKEENSKSIDQVKRSIQSARFKDADE